MSISSLLIQSVTLYSLIFPLSFAYWSYSEQEKWPGHCNVGNCQSPINIECHEGIKAYEDSPIRLENINYNVTASVKNKCGISADINCVEEPILSGGGLYGAYIFDSIRFHWPSEHHLNKEQYDAEAQLIFYSSKYPTIEEAKKVKHGIAVVAILFTKTSYAEKSEAITQITNGVFKVSKESDATWVTNEFVLSELIPENTEGFYSYSGSLTMPPCNEVARWFVLDGIGKMSPKKYEKLTTVFNSEHLPYLTTSRDIQPINGRRITYTKFFHEFF